VKEQSNLSFEAYISYVQWFIERMLFKKNKKTSSKVKTRKGVEPRINFGGEGHLAKAHSSTVLCF